MIYIIGSYAWVEYFLASKKGEIIKRLFENEENVFLTIECCIGEIKGWSLRERENFGSIYKVIRVNSRMISSTVYDWIDAAQERFELRKSIKNFGLIDAMLLVKQKEFSCKIISGDHHFKDLKNVIYLEQK